MLVSPFEATIQKGDKNSIENEVVLFRIVAYIYVLAATLLDTPN